MDTVWIDPVDARAYARRLEDEASALPASGNAPSGALPASITAAVNEIVAATTQGYDAMREVGTTAADELHRVAEHVEAADASPVAR